MLASDQAAPGAIVLVGGKSRRMGTDKARLVVDGQAMVDRVIEAATRAGATQFAIAGTAELPDPAPEQGPLAGVVAGWQFLRSVTDTVHDPVLVLACDLPALTARVVAELVNRAPLYTHGVVAHDGARPQPLLAAYRPIALDALEKAYEDGERSVRRCFDGWDLGTVAFERELIADADRPEDLEGFDVQWPS